MTAGRIPALSITAARVVACCAFVVASGALVPRPALADSPLEPITVGAGAQFATSGGFGGSPVLGDLTASYDFGPRTIVPIRAAIEANVLAGQRAAFGGGLSVRLTTPLYAGFGVGVYSVTQQSSAPALVVGNASASGGASAPNSAAFETEYFVGERLFSVPGATVSLQATYRLFTTTDVIPVFPSNAGLGLRVKF